MGLINTDEERAFLSSVENVIDQILGKEDLAYRGQVDFLLGIASHLCHSASAKRARPTLTFYFAHLLGVKHENLVHAAVAAELIHSASLLHDDVVDEAHKRRGKPSANLKYGNKVAVLAGNYLLTESFGLLLPYPQRLTQLAIEVISEMTKAAIFEIQVRGRVDISFDDWRALAAGKTGALFGWCGMAAAVNGELLQAMKPLQQIGRHIGAMFQMADDLKDLSGDNALKDQFSDIRNREPSLPILIACRDNADVRKVFGDAFIEEEISEDEVCRLGHIVLSERAKEKTYDLMAEEYTLIKKMLDEFPASKGKESIAYFLDLLMGASK